MKEQQIKRYRLSVSRTFPMTHPRKGEQTYFIEKINVNENVWKGSEAVRQLSILEFTPKLHTIRANYQLWWKRMAEVQAGNAVIELFYWSDKPYRSPQVVFATLDMDSGCEVQELDMSVFNKIGLCMLLFNCEDGKGAKQISTNLLVKNDGLKISDFYHWFRYADLNESMAIIHFTKFRY